MLQSEQENEGTSLTIPTGDDLIDQFLLATLESHPRSASSIVLPCWIFLMKGGRKEVSHILPHARVSESRTPSMVSRNSAARGSTVWMRSAIERFHVEHVHIPDGCQCEPVAFLI